MQKHKFTSGNKIPLTRYHSKTEEVIYISAAMINYYLDTITVGYFNGNDVPPDQVTGYYDLVQTIRQKAIKHGDMDHLQVALAWLLVNEQIDLEDFNGGRYPFDAEEMRKIIAYVYEVLFSNWKKPSDDLLKAIRVSQIPLNEWWQDRST